MSLLRRDLVSKAWMYLSNQRRTMLGLAVLAVIAAQAESTALVSIALIAEGAARGDEVVEVIAGPIELAMSVTGAATMAVSAIVLAGGVGFLYSRLSAVVSARLEREGRDQIVEAFAEASWEYQSSQKSSHIQGRLLRLMDARAVTFSSLVNWARALATILVFIVVAAVMSITAALVIVMFGALLSGAVFPIRRRIGRFGAIAARREVNVATDFAEAVDHGADVRVFGAWPSFIERYAKRSTGLEDVRARLTTTKGLMPIVYQYGALSLILALMVVAIGSASSGEFGQFAAAALLLLRSVQYGQQLQQALQNMAEAVPRIELLDDELATPPPVVVPGETQLTGIERLEMRNLSYSYPDAELPAINGITLDLKPGSIVGVAGPSGSGKSTLAQIILRLRWPTSGEYLVNGQPADAYSATSWNHLVSHVPQHPLLLHGSLLENVTFLDESISREDATRALNSVGLTDLMEALPGGLDARVGPTERSLSGGQVQRLGIARALARRPQLIILDEPTSALDVDSERIVGDALEALRQRPDVLVMVIAHRPSTLGLCDEMVVLHDGEVEVAGHVDLASQESTFLSRTWESEVPGRSSAPD